MRDGEPGVEVSPGPLQPRTGLWKAHRTDSRNRRRIEESAVLAGPAEAAALGNIAIQILATGDASSLQEVRAIVERSFPTEIFEPLETDKWERQTERFEQYCEIMYA